MKESNFKTLVIILLIIAAVNILYMVYSNLNMNRALNRIREVENEIVIARTEITSAQQRVKRIKNALSLFDRRIEAVNLNVQIIEQRRLLARERFEKNRQHISMEIDRMLHERDSLQQILKENPLEIY